MKHKLSPAGLPDHAKSSAQNYLVVPCVTTLLCGRFWICVWNANFILCFMRYEIVEPNLNDHQHFVFHHWQHVAVEFLLLSNKLERMQRNSQLSAVVQLFIIFSRPLYRRFIHLHTTQHHSRTCVMALNVVLKQSALVSLPGTYVTELL
jgi:hypothetical protein